MKSKSKKTFSQNLLTSLKRWGPVVLVMAAIFYFSNQPGGDPPAYPILNLIYKKSAHMLGYALLATSVRRALYSDEQAKFGWRASIFPLIYAVLYAVSDEYHQSFTPLRNPSPVDVLIDTTGACLGLLAFERFSKLRQWILKGLA
jgi:VanZ family protein